MSGVFSFPFFSKARRIRQSEERFRGAFESAAVAEVQINPATGRYIRANAKMCEITGFSQEELLQKTFLEITHPDDRERDRVVYGRFVRGETPEYRAEKRYVRKDGGIVWVNVTAALVHDRRGKPVATIGVIQDVTERRRVEEQLRESERRKAAVLNGAMDSIVVIDEQGRILELNPAAERTFRVTADQVVGRNVAEAFVPSRMRVHFIEVMARLVLAEKDPLFERRLDLTGMRAGGEEFPAEFSVARVKTAEHPMLIGFVRDVSEAKRAEEENNRSRQLLSMHVEQTPLGVIQWDPNFRVKDWNLAAERIFGFSRQEAIGRHATFIIPGSAQPFFDQNWRSVLIGQSGYRSSNENVTRSGKVIFCEWYNTPLVDSNGVVMGVASLVEDITDRKQSEREREALLVREREARVAAETLVKTRNDFISIVSHELRTPLTPLKIILATMRRQLEKEPVPVASTVETFKHLLGRSAHQLDTLIEIMDDVLDLSRLGETPVALRRERVDWSQLLQAMVARYRHAFSEAGCEVRVDIEEGIVGEGDPVRLRRALDNLMSNALKFGRGKPIEISARSHDGEVQITVQDHGIGIARDDFEKLFAPFERLASIRNYSGLGLGLYVAQQIIAAHRGEIEVYSEPGEGARFTVKVPLASARESGLAQAS